MAKVCKWERVFGDYDYVCKKVAEKKPEPEQKGNWWGWFTCALASSRYTKGCEYDKFKDICKCEGTIRSNRFR